MKYYAQFGEDIFLEKLFEEMKIEKGFFVDVGAWDGKHLSNTYIFIGKGWNGIEIEADTGRANKARETLPKNIQVVNWTVKPKDLDGILQECFAPKDFDLLSIDIDSYDYEVWKNLIDYEPKVVVIEVGSATTPEAMKELGKEKGYELIWDKSNYIFKKK